jgi:predicted RNase H-like HicB family nuclease
VGVDLGDAGQTVHIEIEREDDGRFLASVPDLPGVMAYGKTEELAVRKVKAIALQVLADMLECGDEVPERVELLFRPLPQLDLTG